MGNGFWHLLGTLYQAGKSWARTFWASGTHSHASQSASIIPWVSAKADVGTTLSKQNVLGSSWISCFATSTMLLFCLDYIMMSRPPSRHCCNIKTDQYRQKYVFPFSSTKKTMGRVLRGQSTAGLSSFLWNIAFSNHKHLNSSPLPEP